MESEQQARPSTAEVLAKIIEMQPTAAAKEADVEDFMKKPGNSDGKSASEIAQSYLDNRVNNTI